MPSDPFDQIPALVEAARNGDREALGLLLEFFRPFLLQVATDQISGEFRGKAAASDLVQQSFLDAHQNFPTFRGGTPSDVASWLKNILEHNFIDLTRRYRSLKREVRREVPLDGSTLPKARIEDPDLLPEWQVALEEQLEVLEKCLDKLSLEHRLVIKLRQKENLPFAKIGDLLSRSEDAARKLWARAIEQLRKEIDRANGDRGRVRDDGDDRKEPNER